MNPRLPTALLSALLFAQPVAAQSPHDDDRLERFLDYVERSPLLQFSTPRDGLGVRFGGIAGGSGLAAGPTWRQSNLSDGQLQLHASAAASIARDRQAEGGVTLPNLLGQRLKFEFGSTSDYLAVPFYLQPTLGGSRYLRGFVTDRFRDRNLMLMQAEYGWDIWPFLNAVVFYERGAVFGDWRRLSLKWIALPLPQDYGFGCRFGSARTVGVRTDVAFGSGEGTRLTMRFSHAF